MAGIYVHVPFCKKKCSYCDFYSIGSSDKKDNYSNLIIKEIDLRKDFIGNETIDTIYFGGGTPSLLSVVQVDQILNKLSSVYSIANNPEITLEANPDDITKDLLAGFHRNGVNRLSIGIQSFNDNELFFLGRRHDVLSAINSIDIAKNAGFENLSIDLIYGLPGSSAESWIKSLSMAFNLAVNHLSCYHLSYEKGTPIYRKLITNQIKEVDEDISVTQFNLLRKMAQENNFIHYEVSNLAKDGFFSQHNTSYWKGISYLGLGPAAHSYNGQNRQWNPKSYDSWANGIELGVPSIQGEYIDTVKKFNENLLTRLRTIWGVNLSALKKQYGEALLSQLLFNCESHLKEKRTSIIDNNLVINSEFLFVSDGIISDLLIVE